VHLDGLRSDDTELSTEWDDIWHGVVAHTAQGRNAELRESCNARWYDS
jgi:hypothetical protein